MPAPRQPRSLSEHEVAELWLQRLDTSPAGFLRRQVALEAQALPARHVDWLRSVPGTPPSKPGGDLAAYVLGLADMYVADPRFAANYATSEGGSVGAEFVRDALRIYVEAGL